MNLVNLVMNPVFQVPEDQAAPEGQVALVDFVALVLGPETSTVFFV